MPGTGTYNDLVWLHRANQAGAISSPYGNKQQQQTAAAAATATAAAAQ